MNPTSDTPHVTDTGINVQDGPAAPLSELTGIVVRTTEIAALRLNAKKGVEGNEVLFRSGVTVTLSYDAARTLAEKLREAGEFSRPPSSASGNLVYASGK